MGRRQLPPLHRPAVSDAPPPLVMVTPGPPRGSVIFLHGLGADGRDFSDLPSWLGLPGLRYVFPHAPIRPVSLNGGIPMRAWFDLGGLTEEAEFDREGLEESVEMVARLLEAERERAIVPTSIVLGGFSQGGAVALYAALTRGWPLAGVVGLSTFLPTLPAPREEERPVPVFLAHGRSDPIVAYRLGEETGRRLRGRGHEVRWWTHAGGHTVDPGELAALAAWIAARLPPPRTGGEAASRR